LGVEKRKLTIVVQEGGVTAIISDEPECFGDLDIDIINYDAECTPRSELTAVCQPSGAIEYAIVTTGVTVDQSTIRVLPSRAENQLKLS
jgi:hypothetical protein